MGKPAFCICENKDADKLRGNREADQRLVFAIRKIQSLFYLNPKFQASSHLLWLYSPICVDLVGNPEDRFSHNEAQIDSVGEVWGYKPFLLVPRLSTFTWCSL